MSNFGKAQLLKYGWSEGKGLGKDENGIAEALKPKLKFDTTGIGHKDSDFQWWSSVYDKALKNVVSDNNSEQVSINVIEENAFNISSSQTGQDVSTKKLQLHYGKFLKTSTLKDGSLIKDKTCSVIEDDKKEEVSFTQISDEELFKACGGRTAHKGARHGLKLSGKLARIAEQEKKLLAGEFSKSIEIPTESSKKSKKAKKRKMDMDTGDCIILQTNDENVSDNEDAVIPPIPNEALNDRKLSKKTARKLKRRVNDLSQQLSKSSLESTEECTTEVEPSEQVSDKKSKKTAKKLKRKLNELSNQLSKSCLLEETTTEDHCSNADESEKQSQSVKKKSKKKKHKRKLDESNICNGIDNIQLDNDIAEPCLKKSKKQRKEQSESEDIKEKSIETDADMESGNSKYPYSTWKNSKIKSKKLKKYEKKKKNKPDSNESSM